MRTSVPRALKPPVALTIAGTDSSGGAGIAADLLAIRSQGVFAALAVTAVTAQNTRGVSFVHPIPPHALYAQIASVAMDLRPRATKIGMLFAKPQIGAVARAVRDLDLGPIVLDPVMISTSGAALLEKSAVRSLIEDLFPHAALVTPNLPEAEALAGFRIRTPEAMREAARRILDRGARAVLLKGGHLPGGRLIDLLVTAKATTRFASPRIPTQHTHGTGCALASAIAARLALGEALPAAVRAAREHVRRSLLRPLAVGSGAGPGDYLHRARSFQPVRGFQPTRGFASPPRAR